MTSPSTAEQERAAIVAWLRNGDDQAAEKLCTAVWAVNRDQRQTGMFVGQPYFDLFADAIEARAYLTKADPR